MTKTPHCLPLLFIFCPYSCSCWLITDPATTPGLSFPRFLLLTIFRAQNLTQAAYAVPVQQGQPALHSAHLIHVLHSHTKDSAMGFSLEIIK